jgi:hypothetical protein
VPTVPDRLASAAALGLQSRLSLIPKLDAAPRLARHAAAQHN